MNQRILCGCVELPNRIENKIERITESGCWIWTGCLNNKGYGQFHHNKKTTYVHRFVFEVLRFTIPDDLCIDHLCRVRCCVNPYHMEPVTNKENILRGESGHAINARKTHCYRGHEFTPANTYIRKMGERECRKCHSEYQNRRYHAAKAVQNGKP